MLWPAGSRGTRVQMKNLCQAACAAVLAVLAIVLGLVHLAVRPTKGELSAAAVASFDLALTELRSRIAARRAALAG